MPKKSQLLLALLVLGGTFLVKSEAYAAEYCASGWGEATANGTYYEVGSHNGEFTYQNEDSWVMYRYILSGTDYNSLSIGIEPNDISPPNYYAHADYTPDWTTVFMDQRSGYAAPAGIFTAGICDNDPMAASSTIAEAIDKLNTNFVLMTGIWLFCLAVWAMITLFRGNKRI